MFEPDTVGSGESASKSSAQHLEGRDCNSLFYFQLAQHGKEYAVAVSKQQLNHCFRHLSLAPLLPYRKVTQL